MNKQGAPADLHHGFRYGFGPDGAGGCAFWEQCAQWQAQLDYPEEMFGYHLDVWKKNYHRHFNHEWMRYASYWLQHTWVEKHGIDAYGRIWRDRNILKIHCKLTSVYIAVIVRMFFMLIFMTMLHVWYTMT